MQAICLPRRKRSSLCAFCFSRHLFLEAVIVDESVQCWSNFRVEYFKIWCLNSSKRTRFFFLKKKSSTDSTISTSLIHSKAFRQKLWANTHHSLESYLPTNECCWSGEFVTMRIRNLQSLVVCPGILWESSLTRKGRMNFWLTVLTGISDPRLCLVFGVHSLHAVMCVLTH